MKRVLLFLLDVVGPPFAVVYVLWWALTEFKR